LFIVFETFYKLSGLPFLLTPDPRFFFGSSGHRRAIAHLVYGLSQQEGFIVVTGEVGAGKTTLVEQLWAQLDRDTYVVARVATTQVSGDDLLRLVMAAFNLGEQPNTDKATLLHRFEQMVRQQRRAGQRCLLVVDEVQNLSLAAIEELRMLSNITADGHATMQTILLGQAQFRSTLARRDMEQLRQPVLASYHLGPLDMTEIRGYIEHRLRTVDWCGDPVWDDDAIVAVHHETGGIPRRINTLCSRLLLFGALEQVHTITGAMVEATADELSRDLGGGVDPASPETEPPLNMLRRVEVLEQHASRQDKAIKRAMDLLESSTAGRA